MLQEIAKGGGDASIVEARFVDGLSDDQVVALFRAGREGDHRELADEARQLTQAHSRRGPPAARRPAELAGPLRSVLSWT